MEKRGLGQWPKPFQQYAEYKGLEKAADIQLHCWPPCLAGRDVVGLAETGSGKTLAFLLPIVCRIQACTGLAGPAALVIVPTRELASQVFEGVWRIFHAHLSCIWSLGGIL